MSKRILHVEDDADTQQLVRKLLGAEGYSVVSASSGMEALDLLKAERFDLVILDVLLHDINGWDIFQLMREMFCLSRVVFLSVMPVSGDQLESLREDGIYDYITKPFDNVDFLRRIRRVLELSRRILNIEGEEETRNLIKQLLEIRGYNVISASSGEEGLKYVDEHVDMVLTDLLLPDMTGWDLLQKIRKNPASRNIKIAFLSRVPVDAKQLMKFQDYDVADYIMKPFERLDFVRRVGMVIDSEPL